MHQYIYTCVLLGEDILIAYVSRGLLSSLTEAKDVLTTIRDENSQTQHRVIVNTYAVVDGKTLTDILFSN